MIQASWISETIVVMVYAVRGKQREMCTPT